MRDKHRSLINYQLAYNLKNDFSKFKVENLVDNSVTDFDLFVSLSNHLILYSCSGYKWERDELISLMQKGYSSFYIKRTDINKSYMYQKVSRIEKTKKELAPKERIKNLEDIGAKFVQCLYEGEVTTAAVRKGEAISKDIVNCIREDPSCVKELIGLAEHDYYTYYHSVRVSMYSVAVAQSMSLTNEQSLQDIALGGLFHDIGKKSVPLKILNKTGPLTNREWEIMRSHPTIGSELVEGSRLPHASKEIILHHHEKANGAGYPHGLDHRSLIMEAQIATLADIFDALTSSRSYQNKRTRYEALDFIKHKLLKTDINKEAFKALISCLLK